MAFGSRAVILGLVVALGLAAAAPARAASGTVEARIESDGYARIVFAFDRAPQPSARLANGVLVVTFAEPVALETAALGKALGALIGVVRRDPDGTAIRLSLNRPVKLVTNEAGEKFFVDLLPASWAGVPPPLPRDVIADLTREAREARDIKANESRLRARPTATLTLDGATHPTFHRLIFNLGGDAPVEYRRSGPRIAVTISAPYVFDAAAARARLPAEFAGLEVARKDGALTIMVPAPGAGAARGFREDGGFILDIDRDDPAKAEQAADDRAAAPAPVANSVAPAREAKIPKPEAVKVDSPAKVDLAPKVEAKAKPESPHVAVASRPAAAADNGPPARPADHDAAVPAAAATPASASVVQEGGMLKLVFAFARRTPAAVFSRGRTLWLVFDAISPFALEPLVAGSGGVILKAEEVAVERGRAARLTLAEPRLVSAAPDGASWIVALGETVLARSGAIALEPAFEPSGRAVVTAELAGLGAVRTLTDPEIGDRIAIATLGGPGRGLPRAQQFVEFQALASAQGLALSLSADDVAVTAGLEQVKIARDGGLAVSAAQAAAVSPAKAEQEGATVLSAAVWAAETSVPFHERENALMSAAALATADDRPMARLRLATFYLVRDRAADAKAVLGAIVEDGGLAERDPRIAILRAAAEVELGRPATALAVLSAPAIRLKPEAALWRAAAEAAAGRPGAARAALMEGESLIGALPAELRARFTALEVELALAAADVAAAAAAFETLEVLPMIDGVGARELLRARLAEAAGDAKRAEAGYQAIIRSGEPAPAAQAELRSVALGSRLGTLASADAIGRLERLVTGWRGDAVEAEGLARLIELYGGAGRWREAFTTLRAAVEAYPDTEDTRALQDRMQERFTELFLGAGVDSLPKLDALALFYDFKELSPGGKRGDELVRRLADKLVEVDLLDQAAELLAYQIDHRLAGAARAQVAARAALVDLMNVKPARALETLRKTRQADLPASLMRTRLRLEARALAETGRVDLALEMADGLEGAEASRLKADILWSARRWPEAGEALEAALGSVWRGAAPLDAGQRADVMRAAIASSLAGDGLAVDRIRQKFAPKMAESPESAGFEVVTAPVEARGEAFREIARSVAATASFDAFLKEYRGNVSQPVAQSSAGKPDSNT